MNHYYIDENNKIHQKGNNGLVYLIRKYRKDIPDLIIVDTLRTINKDCKSVEIGARLNVYWNFGKQALEQSYHVNFADSHVLWDWLNRKHYLQGIKLIWNDQKFTIKYGSQYPQIGA